VVGDTLHYQTEVDANGKLRAIHARIKGVPKQLTLEPVERKRASPSGPTPYDRRQQEPKQRIIRSQKRWGSLPLLLLLLIGVWIYVYDMYGHRHAQTVAQSTPQLIAESEIAAPHFQCEGKVYCSQMTSREEAEFYLDNCPGMKMDGDGDGIPCENQF